MSERKLTKAERIFLEIARDCGGSIKVFNDQRGVASRLEHLGLLIGNGLYIERRTTITEAGRLHLANLDAKETDDGR